VLASAKILIFLGNGVSDVAVITCGPEILLNEIDAICSYHDNEIKFNLHVEEFNL